jgi:hypothetical protein
MKERDKYITRQKAKDDAVMDFVSRQAQEAILDPNLPESFKDEVMEAAVGTIMRIAERRSAYIVKRRKNQRLKRSSPTDEAK